ncbi:uncharacterized protein LOC126908443 [Daktulosphaira vitifoliae]|uniref:uncharacterized protein LOC126908443 n=1 Tax=Daktulosphaira vitifoliae TaxID=58002 RepID=UPI0021AA9D56|nr:uncharacterized protein LOC126908443 [Daktulosphaira vitifoliae]
MEDHQFKISSGFPWIKTDRFTPSLQQQCNNEQLNQKSLAGFYQMERINEFDHTCIKWNISLVDDQDQISECFLKINERLPLTEKFGPAVLTVPENIRKQADELFKPSDINANDVFNLADAKVSWVIQNGYRQYLESIPENESIKGERHVLYPWTQWETSTGTHHRPSPSVGSSPSGTAIDQQQFMMHSTPQNQFSRLHSRHGSPPGLHYSTYNDCVVGQAVVHPKDCSTVMSSSESASSNPSGDNLLAHSSSLCSSLLSYQNSSDQSGGNLSYSGDNFLFDTSVPPPNLDSSTNTTSSPHFFSQTVTSSRSADYSPSPSNSPRWSSRLYYRVNSDSMVHKLIEHYCTFCYKNHEPPEVYGTHLVRDAIRITCPKLRALRCKHCNGTGDNAHTIKYCPFLYSNYK